MNVAERITKGPKMTNKTRIFEARLSDGETTEVEAKWCNDARWFKARVDQQSVYFEQDGTQV